MPYLSEASTDEAVDVGGHDPIDDVVQLLAQQVRLGHLELLANDRDGLRPAEARVSGLVSAATRLGAPLAELLVAQADALRESERRSAEAQARRLPVLMLFPLTFCVLPALLIVFLGPPLLSLLG